MTAPEVGLTEAERKALIYGLALDDDEVDGHPVFTHVARIKADAIQQERAALVAAMQEVIASTEWYCDDDHDWRGKVRLIRRLRALLSSDATEALDAVKAEAKVKSEGVCTCSSYFGCSEYAYDCPRHGAARLNDGSGS